jgi:hypothetical protein
MLVKLCTFAMLLLLASAVFGANEPSKPAATREQQCVARAVAILKQMQHPDGHWEPRDEEASPSALINRPKAARGMTTALAVLALLEGGVSADDPAVRKGLAYLREVDLVITRLVGVQTLALCRAGLESDGKLIRRNVEWFQSGAVRVNKDLRGWGETNNPKGEADPWNTHYAVAALHAAERAGAKVERKWWEDVRGCYLRSQLPDGGWGFSDAFRLPDKMRTVAGVCGLLLADERLGSPNEASRKAVRLGAERLEQPFRSYHPTAIGGLEYRLVLARANVLRDESPANSDRRPFDPYRVERAALLKLQCPDGSFSFAIEKRPELATAYAVLFLAAGE